MAIVAFTLSDDGVAAFQNALACLFRFSEDVSLDSKKEGIVLSALNPTKSAFVSFTFPPSSFSRYNFEGSSHSPDRFFCVLYIRALLSVFRTRAGSDTGRGGSGESSIERCDIFIDDGPGKKSRFVAKIARRNGITATHAVPFEAKAPVRAKFDANKAVNHWAISAQTLRRLMEHFGPKVEFLDINTEGSKVVNLTCFTERQYAKTDGILNMNLRTSIAVKMEEFDNIDVEDGNHIIINVKDFRAILQHACTTAGDLTAHYSDPWQPLRFSYQHYGMLCQFILMTNGTKTEPSTKKQQRTRTKITNDARPALNASSTSTSAPTTNRRTTSTTSQVGDPGHSTQTDLTPATARPPAIPRATGNYPTDFTIRPQPVPPSTIRIESLYDEDSQWEPVNPDEDNPAFVQIEWDESLQPELSFVPISNNQEPGRGDQGPPVNAPGVVEPTQRLTEVRKFGLFD